MIKLSMVKIKPQVIKLREEKMSYSEIARLGNVSVSIAWRYSKHLKINYFNQHL